MEGGCNFATDSSEKHLANACYRKLDFEEVLAKGLVKTQQEAFAGEINLKSSDELLSERLAGWVKGPCDDSQHGPKDKLSVKYTNESHTLTQNDRNVYHCLDEQTIELLQGILTTTKLKKDVGICTLGPNALAAVSLHASPDRNLDLENFKVDFNPTKTFHLPHSRSVHTNVKSAVVKVTRKPSSQATSTTKSMEKDSVRGDWSPSFKGKQLDFFESLKEKLQQKDLENQQIVRLLLKKHQDLRDVKEMLKLKEVEAQLMAEKLKCEEQKNFEVMKRFNNVCEDMNKKLSIAKNHNESFAKQLKALLEKYERLKKRANTIKEQLLEEHTKKKSSQKTVKKIQKMAEELLMNQTLLEKQKDAATRELNASKKKMEKEQKQHIRIVHRVEEEKSVIAAEYEALIDELQKTQKENKKLTEAVQSKELGKRRAEENLLESQNVVKQLYAELDESKTQRESMSQQLDAMKKEIKLIHNRHKVERLQLQEQKQTCMKQCEDLRTECDALNEVVSKLKKDKHMLKEELECHQKEKAKSETASKREGERLREAVSLLERERELLLDEMRDLRKDYFSLSDRITQRLGQLDQADAPMCITDISSFHHCRAPKVDNTIVPVTPSMDVIEHIRRKLEEEENIQQK
ncbi:coiled-coil domain-containing protein 110 [Colossoma macropomum]|uniref:coiled-coil domain-containing protein 110 n=1 Tax=Colossoma macropomum TaxID=42526 RepID=UPI0018656ABA|nr:coiled-coil domain-containing protein 110 [Colossoma macropomum]